MCAYSNGDINDRQDLRTHKKNVKSVYIPITRIDMLTSSKGNTGQSEYQQSSLGSGTKKVEPYCRIDASTPNGTKLK